MCSLLLIVLVCCAAATPPSKPSQSDADNWRALSSFAQAQQDGATIPVGSCEPNLGPPVLNAVPDTAYFTGLKAPSPAYGGPRRAPGQHVVATGMQGTTEAPQPGQGIFDDFPADDSEAQQQHSGNETATEAEREYIGDESTGYCFNEHGNVIAVFAAYPVIEPLIVCALILLSITINDDSDPARNDPRDEFDSAPFTPVNDRRARDVSPGAERSRAPMRRNITAPARMMGSSPARRAIDLRGDFDPVDHFRSEHDEDLDYGSNGPEIAGDNMAREMARAMHAAEGDRVGRAVEPGSAQPSQPSGRPRRNVGQPDRYDQSEPVDRVDVRSEFKPQNHFPGDHGEHDEDLDYGSNGPEIAGDNMAREMARAMFAAEGDRVGRAVEPGGAQPSQPSGRPRRNVGQPDRYDQTGLHLQSYFCNTQPCLRWPN